MRIRQIKPGFFLNEELGKMPPLFRLLFIGMWLIADRAGRLKDIPVVIRSQILPFDDDFDAEAALDALFKAEFIRRYQIGGKRYIQIEGFVKHQRIHDKEAVSIIPPPSKLKPGNYPAEPVNSAHETAERCSASGFLVSGFLGSTSGLSLSGVPGHGELPAPTPTPQPQRASLEDTPPEEKPAIENKTIPAEILDAIGTTFGLTPPPALNCWLDDYPVPWIKQAVAKAQTKGLPCVRAFKYAETILLDWKRNGGPEHDTEVVGAAGAGRSGSVARNSGPAAREAGKFAGLD